MKTYAAATAALIVTVLLVLPLVAACGTSVAATIDDATLSARVKTALLNDPAVPVLRIDVETVRGVVTLSGRVKNLEEGIRAVALARSVSGVRDVKSTLQIQP